MSIKEITAEKGHHTPAPSTTESVKENQSIVDYELGGKFSHGVEREAQGSSFYAYFNVVCVVAGTGALQLPYALAQGGWIGLLILFLSWFFSTYSGVVLIRCLYHDGQSRLTSYQEVAEAAFGKIGGWIAFFFTAITLIGVPILYVMLAGQNIHQVCQGTSAELTFEIWTIICACVVGVPYIFFKSLKEVGVTSLFGVLTTVVTVLIVLAMAVKDDSERDLNPHHDPVIWDMFPIALSSIAFSFGGNPVYPHVEAGMRTPQHWNRVIVAGLSTCVAIYFITAVPGYYYYGVDVASPVYNSLPESDAKLAAIIIITAHVLLAMPVLMTSFALDLEKMLRISTFHHSRWVEFLLRVLVRVIYIVIVTVIAVLVPSFGNIMSLLGAFSNCTLIFIFPIIFYYRLTGFRNKPIYELAFGALAIVLGIVGLIFGSKSAIEGLKEEFGS
ncbi:transmembrane amino acid transporter protein-domain-containing protein [Zychaea mexicana]|uniref:transmembrane amino acid transporter protein-domain-containing protein n=1 Tax=Zychaea mexicana TaxID=64656 RepID=UPI0022FDB966|nr:transmembrane amino acid transporter protein-domain-containing protein [Zychaea mexicana]KAI9499435.1 transmembrane amino acid transporter protein-domain-containing protein [Zychaea mexicana]